MKVWRVKIETSGTFFLKKCPSGDELCEVLSRNVKMADPFLSELRNALKEKGWKNRKLPSLVTVSLGSECGTVSIYCTPVDILE